MTQYMNGIYRNGMKTSCTGLIGRRKLAFVEKVQVGQEQVLLRMIVPFQLPGQIFRFGRDISITSRQGIIPTKVFDGIERMILFLQGRVKVRRGRGPSLSVPQSFSRAQVPPPFSVFLSNS